MSNLKYIKEVGFFKLIEMNDELANLRAEYPQLRRKNSRFWLLQSIEDGLRYFYKIHQRYPNEFEFDEFEFLPKRTEIKRRFGGLDKLFDKLNLPRPIEEKKEALVQVEESRTYNGQPIASYKNLRRQTKGGKGTENWNLASIADGLQYFYDLNGRPPTATEIDDFEFLPSTRSLQRSFGGLKNIRTKLGYTINDFSSGPERSKMAKLIGQRGRRWELFLQEVLIERFGKTFVHIESRFGKKGNRIDFYIHSPSGNFGVDVFFAEDLRSLSKTIRHKILRYADFGELLYLVAIPHQDMATMKEVRLRHRKWLKDCHLVTLPYFLKEIEQKSVFKF